MAANDKETITINPTFLLRGIDVNKVCTEYSKGRFISLSYPETKIQISTAKSLSLSPQYSHNQDCEFFVRTHGSTEKTILTTNHQPYVIMKDSDGHLLPIGGVCNWCRRNIKTNPIGLPIKIEWIRSLNLYNVYVDQPYYCRFQCCFSGYKRDNSPCVIYRDPHYADSEQILKFVYKLVYPDAPPLRDAKDWRLLKCNNGTLTDEEFDNNTHVYKRTANIIFSPIKVEYELTKNA